MARKNLTVSFDVSDYQVGTGAASSTVKLTVKNMSEEDFKLLHLSFRQMNNQLGIQATWSDSEKSITIPADEKVAAEVAKRVESIGFTVVNKKILPNLIKQAAAIGVTLTSALGTGTALQATS